MELPPPSRYELPPVAQDWRRPDWPEVSISVLTYNHRSLVARALDSILAQRVTFDYEIVVGDDGSQDGTQQVLLDYQRRYPRRIRLHLHPRRSEGVAGRANNMHNLGDCRGRYTALLDGDDYWQDPDKLQSQYDMMRRYPGLGLCLHDTLVTEVDHRGHLTEPPLRRSASLGGGRPTGFYHHEDFCYNRNIGVHISSFFFPTRSFGEWPTDFDGVVAADHYLFLLLSQRGPVYYEDRVRSTYERQPMSFCNTDAYLSQAAVYRRFQDLAIYRQRFPATRVTYSYSEYAARHLILLLRAALRGEPVPIGPGQIILMLLEEPRGLWEVIRYRLTGSKRIPLPPNRPA